MADRIKLENIKDLSYDRASGKSKAKVTIEFACSNCRHLVEAENNFCWQCGERLEPSGEVEHYHKGEKLTDEEYQKRVKAFTGGLA